MGVRGTEREVKRDSEISLTEGKDEEVKGDWIRARVTMIVVEHGGWIA